MEIRYDWKLSRVVDGDENVLDQLEWPSSHSVNSLVDRLSDLQSGRLTPEARTLRDRFPDAVPNPLGAISDVNWPELSGEESEMLSHASLILAKRGVANAVTEPDRRLDMLSSASTELRSSWTTQESRAVEWAGLFLPDLDLDGKRAEIPSCIAESDNISQAAVELGASIPEHMPTDSEWVAMNSQARGVISLSERLALNEQATRELATSHVPTLSSLIGPLGAARMVVLAGGRERLARMPSGSLQVLGASGAMAAHRRGAPPPKHSPVLFSMPLVSRSPRWVRGKIARFLAGKCSIAVRIDHFGGQSWDEEQVRMIHAQAEEIRDKFPKPKKRG
ncbi:MAG: hypothetical protein CL965_03850 [Euryarchaeota archaeon]|jgi:nucleolar protein 56|nr:hypothetical protein [Euryarchaeota archaeon]MEC7406559.1 hypothetical protein [Candidatus Thermoplasmatota archaeon]|tara:strand:+ start:1745 stop:2749 length:1005 start_codon:yes stop_codon:yes gene_type:complete